MPRGRMFIILLASHPFHMCWCWGPSISRRRVWFVHRCSQVLGWVHHRKTFSLLENTCPHHCLTIGQRSKSHNLSTRCMRCRLFEFDRLRSWVLWMWCTYYNGSATNVCRWCSSIRSVHWGALGLPSFFLPLLQTWQQPLDLSLLIH